MATNPIIQSYFDDPSIPNEKKAKLMASINAGQDQTEIANMISSKYGTSTGKLGSTIKSQSAFAAVDISKVPTGIDEKVWNVLDEAGKRSIAVNMAKVQAANPERAEVLSQMQKKSGEEIGGMETLPTLGKNLVGAASGAVGGLGKGVMETLGGISDIGQGVADTLTGGATKYLRTKGGTEEETKTGDVFRQGGEAFSEMMEKSGQMIGADPDAISGGEMVGYTGEQLAEFLIPASKISKLAKGAEVATAGSKLIQGAPKIIQKVAPTLAKAATEAVAYGGITAAKEGELNNDVLMTAGISAAFPIIGKLGSKIGSLLKAGKEKAASNMIAKLIKPDKNAYLFGKDPNLALAKHIPAARSWDDLVNKVNTGVKDAGQQIDDVIKTAPSTKTVSVRDLMVKNLDDFKLKNADSATQKTYMQKMMDLVNKTEPNLSTGKLDIVGKLDIDKMGAQELWSFQKKLGSLTQWTGAVGENAANKSLHNLYREVGKRLNQLAPGTKEAQFKYAELLGAQKAIESRAAVATRNTGILTSMVGGGIGAGVSSGGSPTDYLRNIAIGIVAPRIYNSPALRTSLARILAKEGVKTTAKQSGNILKAMSTFLKENAGELAKASVKTAVNPD
jgi:hypothetical protein